MYNYSRVGAGMFLCMVFSASTAGKATAATIYAQSGFNDQVGVNSDPTPNSPYTIGQSVAGQGTGEIGWSGTWFTQNGGATGGEGNALDKATSALEGDGGLEITPASLGSTLVRRSLAAARTDHFVMACDVNAGSVGDLNVLMLKYNYPLSSDVNGPWWRITGAVGSRHFEVFDGQSDNTGSYENTGILQKPGEWQHVEMDINVPAQTFTFSVDGVTYNAPDSLGFWGPAAVLDQVVFFDSAAASVDSVVVRGVPEPGIVGSCGVWVVASLLRRRR